MANSVNSDVDGTTIMKRVRVLDQKQSKYGCRTCKKRKVKCDESLPVCLRCSRSGHACAGYDRVSRSRIDSNQWHFTLPDSVGTPPWYQPEQQSMAQLTLALFSLDPHQTHSKTSAEVSSVLLPQLAATRPYVNAAAGVLGAAYDRCILHRAYHQDHQLFTKLYLKALRQIQDELQQPEPELIPLLVAAMLLAAAESIQHKPRDAFCHLLGAFSMVSLQRAASLKPRRGTSLGKFARNGIIEGLSLVQDVFHRVDYHISMFAWGQSPQFPPLPATNQMLYPASIEDLTLGHPALQQWGLHFIAKALEPQWEERMDFPPALIAQQDYLIAWLKRWLRTYTSLFDTPSSRQGHTQTAHLRILKAQTLAMFIATSNIKPSTQVTYDTYAPQFEEIIRCAEYILNPNDPFSTSIPHRALLPYSPIPGIIHPLFFTARKYRHPVSRRRAIYLLHHAGIEGPFQGDFEARVAARLVEIEENRKPFKLVLAPSEVLPLNEIVDRNRVYMCWTVEPSDQEVGKRQMNEVPRRQMKFSRRRKLAPIFQGMKINGTTLDANGLTRAQKLEVGVNVQLDKHDDRGVGEMWEMWEEVVEGTWPPDTERAF